MWRPFAAAAVAVAAAVATPFAWRAPESRVETLDGGSSSALVGDAQVGRQLFDAKGCSACHQGPDSGEDHGFPNLTQVSSFAGDRRPDHSAEEYVTESIRTPGAFRSPAVADPQFTMPDLGLSDEEIAALVAYLLEP
jgi:mono/diheme cytochrome c family protein